LNVHSHLRKLASFFHTRSEGIIKQHFGAHLAVSHSISFVSHCALLKRDLSE